MSRKKHFLDSIQGRDEFAARRAFMKFSGGCAALGSTSMLSQLLNLKLTEAAFAQGAGSGYKALVCIFLNGGNDSFNMLTPYDDAEHAIYTSVRSFAAKPKSALFPIPVDIASPGGRKLGVHPGMAGVQGLYNSGKLAFVANIGSLVEPTTKTTYNNRAARRPLGLFSHADLIQHWQTSVPQSRSQASGWGGRMADLLTSTHNPSNSVSMNIALGSSNVFQTGNEVVPYIVSSNGATLPGGYSSNLTTGNNYDRISNAVLNGFSVTANSVTTNYPAMYPTADTALGSLYSDLLQRSLAKSKRSSMDTAQGFFNATSPTIPANVLSNAIMTPFTDITATASTVPSGLKSLANNLLMVARVINARTAFSQTRQIFFVSVGGWDHHDNLLINQDPMLDGLSKCLVAFNNATEQLGVASNVTTFTASDFGRTLGPNSSGSDHAWGGNQIVMGGSVAGGKVYGQYPTTLALNSTLDIGGSGRLVPTTSVDIYNAEMATWFGVPNDGFLTDVLPNLRGFGYSEGSSNRPLGFLPAS